jgi:hypothetical protein
MTSYRASSGVDNSWSTAASVSITLPAALQAGDVFVLLIEADNTNGGFAAITAASTGTAPVQAGSTATVQRQQGSNQFYMMSAVFTVACSATDAGKVVTVSFGTYNCEGCYAGNAYTGVKTTAPIDTSGTNSGTANSLACPTLITNYAGSWPLYLASCSTGAGSITVPGTERTDTNPPACFADGGAAAGGAGSSIGGGTFSAPSQTIFITWTIGLTAAPTNIPVSDTDAGSGADAQAEPPSALSNADGSSSIHDGGESVIQAGPYSGAGCADAGTGSEGIPKVKVSSTDASNPASEGSSVQTVIPYYLSSSDHSA